ALPWGIAVLLAVIAVWALTRTLPSPARQVARLTLTLPESAPLASLSMGGALAVSPDGKRLVYVADLGNTTELHLREINRLQTRPLPGTRGARGSFFSPDGQWVGFFAGGELKKLYLDGGKPIVLCESNLAMDGSWGTDDTIFFTPVWSGGLWKISADGGDPVQVTTPAEDEFGHWGARALPGGEGVLFMIWRTSLNDCETALLNRKTGEWRSLVTGAADARYAPTGHILYAQSGTIVAAPFDLERLEIGEPHVPVLADVNQYLASGQVSLGLSGDGLLYYVRGGDWAASRRFVWVDSHGEAEPLPLSAAAYSQPRLSPDGRRLAFTKFEDGAYQVWVHELGGERTTQLTFESSNLIPVWTRDGEWLSFQSYRNGPFDIFHIRTDRSQPEEALLTSPNDQSPDCWSPDGQALLFDVDDPRTRGDIWLLSARDSNNSRPLIQTSASEGSARFHPSGRWIAYVSDQSGRDEVFVQSFPDPGSIIQISADGGYSPRWSRDGRELFYRCGDRIMAVDIRTGLRFEAGSPRELFEGQYLAGSWDVAADGRFIMVKPEPDDISEDVVVVFNWFEELNRLVPIDD
ncbi:MAG: PD40 domain-containing protein, partial [Candidatus Zixiibacteriota bacterium]